MLAVYVKEDGIFRPVKDIDDAGGSENFYIIYQCFDSSYVDTMDARVTKEFISYTHEEYKRRTGDSFGGVMPGFFTDEPQYYRYATAWSNTLPSEFEKAYGYSIFDKLPALFTDFEGADEFRYDYWYLCHKLFINNFIKVIYDWCDENGCQITGHAIEESLLFTQMWCIGGIMPFYEYEHIPGIDYLGRGISSDLSGKQGRLRCCPARQKEGAQRNVCMLRLGRYAERTEKNRRAPVFGRRQRNVSPPLPVLDKRAA